VRTCSFALHQLPSQNLVFALEMHSLCIPCAGQPCWIRRVKRWWLARQTLIIWAWCCFLCGCCVCICAGVEHLLRNVKDATISTLASDVSAKLQALKGLKTRLSDVQVRQGMCSAAVAACACGWPVGKRCVVLWVGTLATCGVRCLAGVVTELPCVPRLIAAG
jgi:hypothetical protein